MEVKLSQLKSKKEIDVVLDSAKQFAKGFENAHESAKSDDSTKCETESKACTENLSILDRILAFFARFFHSKSKQETKNIVKLNKSIENKEFKKTEPNMPAQAPQESGFQQDY